MLCLWEEGSGEVRNAEVVWKEPNLEPEELAHHS